MFCLLLSVIVAANMVLVETGETNRNKRSNMHASALDRLRIHLTRLETKIDQFVARSKSDVQTVQTGILSQCMNYSKQDADRVIAAVERIALSHEENITSSVRKNVSEALVQVLKLWDAHFCMGGYIHHNLSCYRLVRQNLTWEAAENFCQYSGAHLLWFETDGEHEFLKKLLKNEGMNGNDVVWTGGLDTSQSQKWAYPQDSSNTTLLKYFGNVTVRLVKVNSIPYSRVEVYLTQFGGWGPIYDNGWDKNDADVVCRQLGFNDSESAVSNLVDGSNGRYFSTNMNCSGSESNLGECRHNGWAVFRFGSNNAAGVICRYEPAGQPTSYKVRLVGGQRYNEGRVEVRQYSHSSWGIVCDRYWDSSDARVVCRQLGFGNVGSTYSNSYFGHGNRSWRLRRIYCNGYESGLSSCSKSNSYTSYCSSDDAAGVRCYVPNASVSQPSRGCLEMTTRGNLLSKSCQKKKNFICKY